MPQQAVLQPKDITDGVPLDVYTAYRLGRDSACADALITTHVHGRPAALLSKRGPHVAFPNRWWMHGGALPAYDSLLDFLITRVQRECGVDILNATHTYVGLYRTCAPADGPSASTLQPCFAFYLPYEKIAHATTDEDHTDRQLFTLDEYQSLPEHERHWYPGRVLERVLPSLH